MRPKKAPGPESKPAIERHWGLGYALPSRRGPGGRSAHREVGGEESPGSAGQGGR